MENENIPKFYDEYDGPMELMLVNPGFPNLIRDCHKKIRDSTTVRVMVLEEDMHCSVECLACLCDYWDYLFLMSEINVKALQAMGHYNVRLMLPACDHTIFHPAEMPYRNTVTFLGNLDIVYKLAKVNHINGTRIEILQAIKRTYGDAAFIWGRDSDRGFYAEEANTLYNDSKICLDLPVMSVVGPRFFQAGASNGCMMLPWAYTRSSLFKESFKEGTDYICFTGGVEGCLKCLEESLKEPDKLKEISESLRTKILAEHTFKNRLKQILETTCLA
jgi:spore maturation protein CgeB